jgi:hypothetical protein
LIDHVSNLAARLNLKPRAAGLLYPGPSARLISELPSDRRPEQLVVVDGTWHHTKTLVREIPALRLLPRYSLAPTSPSRYRIRRAPNSLALSTVEATVAALRILEPETAGFDQLLDAFDAMVEGQLAHSGSEISGRSRKRTSRTVKNIPLALLGDLKNIVVAYGEAPVGGRNYGRVAGPPIYWVAQRLGSDETFSCAVTPPHPLDETFLGHLELTRGDFAAAVSIDVARQRWAQFRRPNDVVTVFQPGTARLFSYLVGGSDSCLVLKSVDVKLNRCHPTHEDLIAANTIPVFPPQHHGRAGKRLANAIALVQHLNALGSTMNGKTEAIF